MKPIFNQRKEGEPPTLEALKGRALALLTRREHSRAELLSKLTEFGGQSQDVLAVLDELQERSLQDDSRFVDAYIRSRINRGYGPLVISQSLRQKGVAAELIGEGLSAIDSWVALASDVRLKKFGHKTPQDRKEQAKQMRFLMYRGFNASDANRAIKSVGMDEWSSEYDD